MDDLISKQAVLDMWRQMTCYDRTCHARDEGRCTETFCDFKLFEYQINHMPSVKPQEPKIVPIAEIKFDDDMLHEIVEEAVKNIEIEPKTGHWVKTPKAVMGEGYMWYCDKCEHQVYQDSSKSYPSENYCPNCGAKMD